MRLFHIALLFAVALSLSSLAHAQAPPATDPHALARQVVDLVAEPLKNGQMLAMMRTTIQGMNLGSADPDHAAAAERWMQDVFSSGEFEDAFTKIYEETYTVDELKAMLAFYSSPTGRSVVAKSPEITQKTIQQLFAVVNRHIPELKQVLGAPTATPSAGSSVSVAVPASAPATSDDNPPIAHFEVGNVARIPPAPRHLDDMLALVRDGSVLVLTYKQANFDALTPAELNAMQVCVVAQNATAANLADRLLILTKHRVRFTPREARERLTVRETHTTVADLPALLAPYGEVTLAEGTAE